MKKNKSMQVAPGDSNSTTAAGAGAEGVVVRDDLSEGELASMGGGGFWGDLLDGFGWGR
jgi:hypothetical protein